MKKCFLLTIFLSSATLQAFAPVNFYHADDTNLRLPHVHNRLVTLGAKLELGSSAGARNVDNIERNVLAMHDDLQNSMRMFFNLVAFPSNDAPFDRFWLPGVAGTPITFDIVGLARDPGNSQRGNVAFTGDFSGVDLTLFSKWNLVWLDVPGTVMLECYLPVQSNRIRNVSFVDKSPREGTFDADGFVIDPAAQLFLNTQNFNNNLAARVAELGGGDLSPVDSTGIGDLHMLLSWKKRFRTGKRFMRSLMVYTKLGLSFPTGKRTHEDKIFSMPLGNDGAWGVPFGVSVCADVCRNMKAGLLFDFLYLEDNNKTQRVKTSKFQTGFLLLNKARVRREHGLTWQISPFVQLCRFRKNLSFKVAYQYVRHNGDKLRLKDQAFAARLATSLNTAPMRQNGATTAEGGTPEEVINSTNSLRRWDVHNLIVQLNFDMARNAQDMPGAPQFSLFYKRAISGRNIIDVNTFGGQIAFNF